MKKIYSCLIFLCLLLEVSAYTDLTNVEVHDKLLNQEEFFLLDVREIAEYQTKHMAEPAGYLPLTPVLLPFSTQVLQNNFDRLPKDMDIIVYCHSGGRSAAASAFLEGQGFTRIFNMLGGIANWPFEVRDGGFGDHSGKWIADLNALDIEIKTPEFGDNSSIVIPAGAMHFMDSTYIEIHFASDYTDTLVHAPSSNIRGLYRLYVLDPQGFERSLNDSAVFGSTVDFNFQPHYPLGLDINSANKKLTCLQDSLTWVDLNFVFVDSVAQMSHTEFYRWYNLEMHENTVSIKNDFSNQLNLQCYPNPFNSMIQLDCNAFTVFTLDGRFITHQEGNSWYPKSHVPKGIYWIRTRNGNTFRMDKVVFQ